MLAMRLHTSCNEGVCLVNGLAFVTDHATILRGSEESGWRLVADEACAGLNGKISLHEGSLFKSRLQATGPSLIQIRWRLPSWELVTRFSMLVHTRGIKQILGHRRLGCGWKS